MEQIKPQSSKMRWLQCFQKQHTKNYMASSNSFFDCSTLLGIKYITRIRLGLSHLRGHEFKHNFQDALNPICNCSNDADWICYSFFLHCPFYSNERHTLLNGSVIIDHTLLDNTDFSLTQILLFGNTTFNVRKNRSI